MILNRGLFYPNKFGEASSVQSAVDTFFRGITLDELAETQLQSGWLWFCRTRLGEILKLGLLIMTYTYAPAVTQVQSYAPTMQSYTPATVPAQKYTPVLSQVPNQTQTVALPKALTEAQIVFTIVNSEISKFKRQGQNADAKAIKLAYQQYYAGWSRQQLIQAAFALVEIYDQSTGQWRLIANEQELRSKQVQFSKRYHYFKNKRAAA